MDMVLAVMRVTGNSLTGKTDILNIEIAANCHECWGWVNVDCLKA